MNTRHTFRRCLQRSKTGETSSKSLNFMEPFRLIAWASMGVQKPTYRLPAMGIEPLGAAERAPGGRNMDLGVEGCKAKTSGPA